MKRIVASTKWLITYLVILAIVLAVMIAAICIIVYYAQKNEGSMALIGGIVLAYMLPIEAIVLCCLNRKACWVWAEEGYIKRKGLLFGFEEKIKFEAIHSIICSNKTICILADGAAEQPYGAGRIELENNEVNKMFLKEIQNHGFNDRRKF